jgi:hypothetical protein
MKAAGAFFGLPRDLRTRHNMFGDIGEMPAVRDGIVRLLI